MASARCPASARAAPWLAKKEGGVWDGGHGAGGVGQGGGQVALLARGDAQQVFGVRVVGLEAEGAAIEADGLGQPALAVAGHAAMQQFLGGHVRGGGCVSCMADKQSGGARPAAFFIAKAMKHGEKRAA